MVLLFSPLRWLLAMVHQLLLLLLVLAIALPAGSLHAADRTGRSALRSPTRGGEVTIKELEFKKTKVQDAVRVISELTGANIVATTAAGDKRSPSLSATSLSRILSTVSAASPGCGIAITARAAPSSS